MADITSQALDLEGLRYFKEKQDEANDDRFATKANLASINDYTTGINLLRETRDFTTGTNKIEGTSLFEDGWTQGISSSRFSFSTYKDDEGFTVQKMASMSTEVSVNGRYAVTTEKFNKGDYVTLSFEVMCDNVDNFLSSFIVCIGTLRKTATSPWSKSSKMAMSSTSFKSGVWRKVVHKYQIPEDITDELLLGVYLGLDRTGSINFRKVKLERESVDRPIWSASPFDYVATNKLPSLVGQSEFLPVKNGLNKVNDFTTGINLLRETRDCINGTIVYKNKYYNDGFRFSNAYSAEITRDNDGFFEMSNSEEESTTRWVQPSPIKNLKKGETYTLSFDYRYIVLTSRIRAIRAFVYKGTSTEVDQDFYSTVNVYTDELDKTSIKDGEWYKANIKITIPDNFDENDDDAFLGFMFYFRSGTVATSIAYRKLCVYKGDINHPIWSASPFDNSGSSSSGSGPVDDAKLAALESRVDAINDMTTGINLLRGTRDFKIGIERIASSDYFYDGWSNVSNNPLFSVYTDDEGYTVQKIERFNDTTAIIARYNTAAGNFKQGDVLTLSFEVMYEDITTVTATALFNIGLLNKSNSTWNTAFTINRSEYNFKSGEWKKIVYYFTVPKDVTDDLVLGIGLDLNNKGSVCFRKCKLERGKINNPIWSPSPFDIDYINDETTGINLIRYTRDAPIGTTRTPENEYIMLDGFRPNNSTHCHLEKDSDGYGVWRLTGNESSGTYIYSPPVYNLSGGVYTCCIEYMLDEEFSGQATAGFSDVSLPTSNQSFTISNDVERNKWHKAKQTFKVTRDALEGQFIYFVARTPAGSAGNYYVRKICLYQGDINNPIWSASPFDVAQAIDVYPSVNFGKINAEHTIPNNADLNTYINYGTYAHQSATGVDTLKNCPVTTAFKLYVEDSNGGGSVYIRQRLVIYSEPAIEYIRFSSTTGTNWTDWRQTYANTTIRPVEGGGTGRTDGRSAGIFGKSFITGDDLDTFTSSGRWYSGSTTLTQSLLNKPNGINGNHFTLDVTPYSTEAVGTSAFQEFTVTQSDSSIRKFIRLVKANAKTEWAEVLTTLKPVPIEGGGTGATTAKAAQYYLLNDMEEPDTDVTDSSIFVQAYGSAASTTHGKIIAKPASKVWNWIKHKILSDASLLPEMVLSAKFSEVGNSITLDSIAPGKTLTGYIPLTTLENQKPIAIAGWSCTVPFSTISELSIYNNSVRYEIENLSTTNTVGGSLMVKVLQIEASSIG